MHPIFTVSSIIANPDNQVWEVLIRPISLDEKPVSEFDDLNEMIENGEE